MIPHPVPCVLVRAPGSQRATLPPACRIASRLVPAESGCWEWPRPESSGYGSVSHQSRHYLVHRVVYELVVGPIPAGLEIDHLCRNRACANPSHLEAVTREENMRRMWRDAHGNHLRCRNGHPRAAGDPRSASGTRRCLECERKQDRERRATLRAQQPPKPPRTECANGHSLTGERSIYVYPSGKPACRACINDRAARYRGRLRQAVAA